jgi:hypothetical protein
VGRGSGTRDGGASGLTIPPEIRILKASSLDKERVMASSSGTIAYQPVVGFGVVGIKTLSTGLEK